MALLSTLLIAFLSTRGCSPSNSCDPYHGFRPSTPRNPRRNPRSSPERRSNSPIMQSLLVCLSSCFSTPSLPGTEGNTFKIASVYGSPRCTVVQLLRFGSSNGIYARQRQHVFASCRNLQSHPQAPVRYTMPSKAVAQSKIHIVLRYLIPGYSDAILELVALPSSGQAPGAAWHGPRFANDVQQIHIILRTARISDDKRRDRTVSNE